MAASAETEYSTIDGATGSATVYLYSNLGNFNDVKPESIALEDSFAGGKVESVAKEGEDVLKVELSFPANGQNSDDYLIADTVKLAAGAMSDVYGELAPEVESTVVVDSGEAMGKDAPEDTKKNSGGLKDSKKALSTPTKT